MLPVMIATMGAEPQVVTLATQLLLRRNEALAAVAVLHTDASHPPLRTALPILIETFAAHPNWPKLALISLSIDDILEPRQIDRFADALFAQIKKWKQQGHDVHLLLAGGRKPMAMVGMSIAQMLLGPGDRIWYLYSDDALRQAGRLTLAEGDEAYLIPMPLPRMTAANPTMTTTFQASSPTAARTALEAARERRLSYFVEEELTRAERAVAGLVVREVLTVNELAQRLQKSPKTAANQLNQIYSKLEAAFGLQPDNSVKREFLRQELAPYFKNR